MDCREWIVERTEEKEGETEEEPPAEACGGE